MFQLNRKKRGRAMPRAAAALLGVASLITMGAVAAQAAPASSPAASGPTSVHS